MRWPQVLFLENGDSLDLLKVNDPLLETNEARYGKEGRWAVTVQRGQGVYQILPNETAKHLAGKQLYKANKMFRADTTNKIVKNVKQETIDVGLLTVGKLIYVNMEAVLVKIAPKLKWYEKLFTSKEKRELATLVGAYIALQAIRTKYDHYLIQAVTAHINFEFQSKLVGGISQETIDKIFTKLETK